MAEVVNLPQAPATELSSSVSVSPLDTNVPNKNLKNEVNDLSSGVQLGTSPNHEKSNNSHHHDSEYDTASDLEGGVHDDYDDEDDVDEEDDEDDDSLEDGGNTDTDSVEFDAERQRGDGQEQADYNKKVDEDRSNPQYIPKKGTFYEHDDRTADEPEGAQPQSAENTDLGENKATSPTTISQASKTMKKWQPASGVDRWSHDRFDPNEQAPKSKAELVSAYGYDIRNEDGPPRARRRRRYARGPSKYSRNWEDETAYIKASNAQRKPPKPEDFPALEERQKTRKSRSYRDEKENRFERQSERGRTAVQQAFNRDNKDNVRRSTGNTKIFRTGVRQPAMEFKNKSRPIATPSSGQVNSSRGNNIDKDVNITMSIVNQGSTTNTEQHNFQKASNNNKSINMPQTVKVINQHAYSYDPQSQQQINNANTSGYNSREINEKFVGNQNNRQLVANTNGSNLSARLQQAQNRNDPSHVGSVQMHTLANQHKVQVTNPSALQNSMLDIQQQQQQQQQHQQQAVSQEHARTKRYSSLRQRSQHDAAGNQHLDQHTLQQLQMQHEVQQQQQIATNVHPSQQLMLQEQHLIQANLMQLYHQENLQAQMQALQVSTLPQTASPQPNAAKPPYNPIQQQYSAGSSGPPAAYYTTPASDYGSAAATAGPSQPYQQPNAFLQAQTPTAPLAFNPTPPQPVTQNAMAPPIAAPASAQVPTGAVNYVQNSSQNPSATPTANYPNYPNYQNFNTVGGTTYFVPSPQTTARAVVLPQRRPTNAIPILPPSEKTKRPQDNKEGETKNGTTALGQAACSANAPIGSAENIDHILDNMFVQRPPYQPQTRKSSSPPSEDTNKMSTSTSGTQPAPDSTPLVKPRSNDPSAVASLPETEPSTTQSIVSEVITQNAVVGASPPNAEQGTTSEAPPLSESAGKQSAIQ